MNKKYIWWEIKRVITPFAIVIGAGLFVLFIETFTGNITDYGQPYLPMTWLIGYVCVISAVFPLFVMQYKFGLIRADFYRQLPFGPREFKRQTLLVGLVVLLIGGTILYLFGVGAFALKYISTPQIEVVGAGTAYEYTITRLDFNFLYFLIGFIVMVAGSSATYFISALMVHYNANVWESIVCIVLSQLVIGLIIISPQVVISLFINRNYFNIELNYSFSAVSAAIFGYALDGAAYGATELISKYYISLNFGVYLLIGLGAALWVLLVKEKSAELTNAAGKPNIVNTVLVHTGFALVILLINWLTILGEVFALVLTIFAIVAYFFFNVIYRHGFKLEKKQFIPYIVISVLTLAISFILTVT